MHYRHAEFDRRITQEYCCPKCGFCLRGFPAAGTCPQCHFEYDPHAQVISLHGNRIHAGEYRAVVAVVVGIPFVTFMLIRGDVYESVGGPFKWLQWIVFVVFGAYVLIRVYTRWGARQELRMNRRGVQFIDPSIPQGIIEWDRFARAIVVEERDEFVLQGPDGAPILAFAKEIIGCTQHVQRCIERINTLREQYLRER